MLKKAFFLWLDIAIFMFLIIFVDFILFLDVMEYTKYWVYMKEIFIGIFIITILISIWAVGYFFKLKGFFNPNGVVDYLKLYWSIFWRAMVFVVPIVGIIAYVFKGSIESRFLTIFVEILIGFVAIYWYLRQKY